MTAALVAASVEQTARQASAAEGWNAAIPKKNAKWEINTYQARYRTGGTSHHDG